MSFREVTFKDSDGLQSREQWLQWRQNGIGSSDASVIMGVSRFNNWDTLLSQKAKFVPIEDNQNTFIKERGNKIEFQVRMFLEKTMGEMQPFNAEHSVFPFLRASLDCGSKDRRSIAEIKLLASVNPAKPNYETDGYKKWLAARDEQKVPSEYWPQVQHQLFITGAEVCFFVGYREVKGNQIVTEDKLAIVPVYPNKEYQERLFLECCRFWYKVEERKRELIYKGELE